MSDPDGRYDDAPHGSTAFPGGPLPGQPVDQPTERVPLVPSARDEPATDHGFWARADDGPYDDRDHDVRGPGAQDDADTDPDATRPDYRTAPVLVRRADTLAGLLLLLAGIAAGVSLLVVWVNGGGTGLDLVRAGVDDLGAPQRLADRDTWEPLTVLVGGGVLFLLGLLAYVPARTHRLLGVLALLVSLAVAAAVLVPLAEADWDLQRWAVGAWFTVAVAGLGFLGALKALSTGPRRR